MTAKSEIERFRVVMSGRQVGYLIKTDRGYHAEADPGCTPEETEFVMACLDRAVENQKVVRLPARLRVVRES